MKRGMTLFELLIVITLLGVIYSIGVISIKNRTIENNIYNLNNIKENLISFNNEDKKIFYCLYEENNCYINYNNKNIPVKFENYDKIISYNINKEGDLIPNLFSIIQINEKNIKTRFFISLDKNNFNNFLILKNNSDFYVYSPLKNKPEIFKNENELKRNLYSEAKLPMKSDTYYEK